VNAPDKSSLFQVPPDVYELVWRAFKNTLIHELVYRFRDGEQHEWTDWTVDPIFLGNPAHHYRPSDNKFLYWGFPLPEHGGIPFEWGNNSCVRIFMDDLFLCPDCGAFHPIRRRWPTVPWMDCRERRIDTTAMFEAIKQRRSAKEFEIRRCEHRDGCERTIKLRYEELKREDEMESARLAWAARLEEIQRQAQITAALAEKPAQPIKPPSEPVVYLISASGHVKVGIATNIKNRFSSLQVSCPFPLKLLKTWKCANAREKEYSLHNKFAQFRQNGEWFLFPDLVLNELMAVDDLDVFLGGPKIDESPGKFSNLNI
jgi:hypothetical protein